MISFNIPPYTGNEIKYMQQAVEGHKICGDGPFTRQCSDWLERKFGAEKVLLTTSGTTALDMAALLSSLNPGDEVILPSFTFSSTATAFVLAGAKLGETFAVAVMTLSPAFVCSGCGGALTVVSSARAYSTMTGVPAAYCAASQALKASASELSGTRK